MPPSNKDINHELDDTHTIHSFILRIWIEEQGGGKRSPAYRGQVVSLPEGERFYIKKLEEIATVVRRVLEDRTHRQVG